MLSAKAALNAAKLPHPGPRNNPEDVHAFRVDVPRRMGYHVAMAGSETGKPPSAKVIGGFEVLEKIGQGAMGAVFKARQISLDRVVALKVLPPRIAKDAVFIDRFQREARASARLNHPNIVLGIDVGEDEALGLWYFAMEYVDGPSLKEVLEKEQKLSEPRALKIMLDMARALECAWRSRVVHRDIKPDNILLASNGEAKLADLGLAKKVDADDAHLTQSGRAVGTPHYMAPEQARGDADAFDTRTDLYALGATFFHLVTGRTPFQAATPAAIMAKHLTEKPPLASEVEKSVSAGCAKLIAKLLEKKPESRVQTPEALIEELESLLAPPTATGKRSAVRGNTTGPRVPIRGLTTGPRSPVAGRSMLAPAVPAKQASSPAALLGMVAGVVLLLVIAVVAMSGGKEAPKPVQRRAEAPTPPPVQPVSLPRKSEPLPAEAKKPEPVPVPVVPAPVPVPEPAKVAEPAPAEPLQPVPEAAKTAPEPPKPEVTDIAVVRAKYEAFHAAFIEALRKGDSKDAEKRLAAAESDKQLATVKDDLALDRKALNWLPAFELAVAEGARELLKGADFELKLQRGQPVKVGKSREFQVTDVKDGTIMVGSKGMGMPIPLARLHAETRQQFAEEVLSHTGDGRVALAFLRLLTGGSPAAVRLRLEEAAAAGARPAEVQYVRRVLERLEKGMLEAAAVEVWKQLEAAAAPPDPWSDETKKAVTAAAAGFKDKHGATEFARQQAGILEKFLARAALRGSDIPREGLGLWLRSDAGLTVKDNGVVLWADQSGRNRHALQDNPAHGPAVVPNGLGKLVSLRFDGNDDHLTVPELKGEQKDFTLLWTLKPYTRSNWNQSLSAGGGWGEFVFHTTSDGGVYVGSNVPSRISPGDGCGRDTVVLNEWQQFAYVFEQGMASFYKNGKRLAQRKLDVATWNSFRISGFGGSNGINGEMSELIYYERALADEERAKVEKHLLSPTDPKVP